MNALSFSTAAASARTSADTTVGAAGLAASTGASVTVVCALAWLTVNPPTGPDVASEADAGTGCERVPGSVSMDPSTITCFSALCIPVCIYDAPHVGHPRPHRAWADRLRNPRPVAGVVGDGRPGQDAVAERRDHRD